MAQQFGMGLSIHQSMKQTQRLIMTAQMQQAIQLLQMNSLELEQLAQQEMLENPFLELNDEESEISEGAEAAEEGVLDRAESQDSDDAVINDSAPDAFDTSDQPDAMSPSADDDGGRLEEAAPEETFDQVDADWDDIYDYNESPGVRAPSIREIPEDEKDFSEYTALKVSLGEHLQWQLETSIVDKDLLVIGDYIINNINDDGYLLISDSQNGVPPSILTQDADDVIRVLCADLGASEEDVRHTLRIVHSFDPAGVGARNLAECLALQLRDRKVASPLPYQIVGEHFDLFLRRKHKELARALGVTEADILQATQTLAALEPRPGRSFSVETPHYIKPDVHVDEVDGKYVCFLDDGDVGRLKINDYYRRLLQNKSMGMTDKEREYALEKFKSAQWLLKNIEKRKSTILLVTETIMEHQQDFLEKGVEHLHPLILRQIAEKVGMHESTIARVTNSKYVKTPRGIFSLKFFFSSGLETDSGEAAASRSIKEMIREIIDNETPKSPLSDQSIAEMLADRGIKIARRTVAKYREQMKILPAKMRKAS